MSLAAYAHHRGVDPQAVIRAVRRGRLSRSLVMVQGHPKVADVALADQEWEANTDLTKAPATVKARAAARGAHAGVAPTISLAEAAAEEKRWKAERAKLDFQMRSGELVSAKEWTAALAEDLARFRSKVLGLPSKAKQVLPHLSTTDLKALNRICREMLEELAVMRKASDETGSAA